VLGERGGGLLLKKNNNTYIYTHTHILVNSRSAMWLS
jgi:hypothetical protein